MFVKKNDNIHYVFIKSIWYSWFANVQYTQLVFQKAIKVWRSKIILSFAINHDFKLFLIYWIDYNFLLIYTGPHIIVMAHMIKVATMWPLLTKISSNCGRLNVKATIPLNMGNISAWMLKIWVCIVFVEIHGI